MGVEVVIIFEVDTVCGAGIEARPLAVCCRSRPSTGARF
jgi:hypothetical protein